jgi:hypothetical protein
MSSPENPIVENDPVVLKSIDEFDNERTDRLVKFFHANLKPELKDPNKHFIVLTNSDISYKKWRAIWSNDPNQLDHLFAELTEKEDQKNPVLPPEELKDVPKLIPIFSASANDYYTDPETSRQYFPDNIFNYDNNNYWKSIIEEDKELRIQFQKTERVKYLVIDFLDSTTKQYEFEIGWNSGVRDKKTGNLIDYYIPDSKTGNGRLKVTSELKDELQFIEFSTPLVTNELILNFTSKEAGVNFLFPIENDLSKEAIKAFLEMNSS